MARGKLTVPVAALVVVIAVVASTCCASTSMSVSSHVKMQQQQRHAWHAMMMIRGGGIDKGKLTTTTTRAVHKVDSDHGGTATIPNEIFNLVKSIVGAGVLGLPAGIAAFGNAPTAIWPASALVLSIGLLSAYGFGLIGRVCAYTGAKSYREAWAKTVSPQSSWVPATSCLLVTSCSVVAYSMILSDTIPQLLQSIGIVGVTRTQALLGITCTVLLRLCLLKQMSSLAPFSLVGIIGMIFTSIAMAIRYFGGQYREGGIFWKHVPLHFQPTFGDLGASSVWTPNAFVLISMLSTAFMAHYNAPKFYYELKNPTFARYQTVVSVSFAISILLFLAVSSLGFLTFGQASSGLVLNNYSTTDTLMSVSRIAVAVSILFSYPLAFVGVRDGVLDLTKVPLAKRTDGLLRTLTVVLLTIITALAFVVKDLRMVLALGGATWGNAVIYLYPTYMFVKLATKQQTSLSLRQELQKEVPLAVATGLMGLVMGVIGTTRAIQSM